MTCPLVKPIGKMQRWYCGLFVTVHSLIEASESVEKRFAFLLVSKQDFKIKYFPLSLHYVIEKKIDLLIILN